MTNPDQDELLFITEEAEAGMIAAGYELEPRVCNLNCVTAPW